MTNFKEGQWLITKDKKKVGYVEEILYSEYYEEPKITIRIPFRQTSIQRDLSDFEDYETPKLTFREKEELRQLYIDLALLSHDKSWFQELMT